MSTSYYLRRKPSNDEINELKSLIDLTADGSNYQDVLDKVEEMYTTISEKGCEFNSDRLGQIDLGHRAAGWKFSWAPNLVTEYVKDENGNCVPQYHTLYPLTKRGILDFIMNDQYIVVDEYDNVCDKVEFMEMALNWKGYDYMSYSKEHPEISRYTMVERQKPFIALGYQFDSVYQYDFESDGLRFSIF